MARAKPRSVAHRVAAALADAAPGTTVAALCRDAGISRNTLYRFYPEAVRAIRRLRGRPSMKTSGMTTIHQLRTQLAQAHRLSRQLVALVDHYVLVYREAQEQLQQRERELSELRRSRGSLPTGLRRARLISVRARTSR